MKFPLAVRAVFFDLDGTLLDTAPDLSRAANSMLADLNFPALDHDTVTGFIGKGIANLVKRTLAEASGSEPDPEIFAHALDIFSRHYENGLSYDSEPYPGVVAGLTAMRAAGFHLGCLTNKASRFTLPLLAQTGLAPFFTLTIAGDTLSEKKPHPLPLLDACERLRIAPRELLLIGDSANDTECARAAGCPVFCVSYGYDRNVSDLKPDAIVADLVEAAGLIALLK